MSEALVTAFRRAQANVLAQVERPGALASYVEQAGYAAAALVRQAKGHGDGQLRRHSGRDTGVDRAHPHRLPDAARQGARDGRAGGGSAAETGGVSAGEGRRQGADPGGRYFDDKALFEKGPVDQTSDIWSRLSPRCAENASGEATGWVHDSWSGSIWNRVEKPARQDDPFPRSERSRDDGP